MNKPIISAKGLALRLFSRHGFLGRKTFSHWALQDVSFDVRRGEVFGVIGRNGAGKSSLLKVLARIYEPDRGRLFIRDAKTCLLNLQTGFISDLTGYENAILSGMLMGNSREMMMERLPEISDFSELGAWLDQPISTYSSGMKARLGFSTAVYADADIILVDEVLSVGDAAFRKKSQAKMKDLLKSDRTIIFVSHNINSVKEIADRAVWIEAGNSVACGKPEKICDRYLSFMESQEKLEETSEGTQDKEVVSSADIFTDNPSKKAAV